MKLFLPLTFIAFINGQSDNIFSTNTTAIDEGVKDITIEEYYGISRDKNSSFDPNGYYWCYGYSSNNVCYCNSYYYTTCTFYLDDDYTGGGPTYDDDDDDNDDGALSTAELIGTIVGSLVGTAVTAFLVSKGCG